MRDQAPVWRRNFGKRDIKTPGLFKAVSALGKTPAFR
jgi:hypothetical protein